MDSKIVARLDVDLAKLACQSKREVCSVVARRV